MRLREFIKQNRHEIDRCVWNFTTHRYNQPQALNSDKEREEWVMNDEGLYRWAQSEGCKI
jgi:hypothetical protein